MDFRAVPVGISDFAQVIKRDSYYIDKTLLIRDLIDNNTGVTLFTRPRRFGKTLNISMLKYFFEDSRDYQGNKKDWSHLFKGLKIMDAGEKYLKYMGQYPVICLTFKDAKRDSFEMSCRQIAEAVSYEFRRYSFITESPLLSAEKELFEKITEGKGSEADNQNSIFFLSKCLETYFGKKAIVLIDEYDVPLENAFSCGFYERMVVFLRAFFEKGLKDNVSLEFAAITGCLRVSRESIFTGLNNFNIASVRNDKYAEYFGFTVKEVEELCRYYSMDDRYPVMKDWYNGYTFGKKEIYNPWSIVNFVSDLLSNKDCFPEPYWVNTSSNDIVRSIIDRAGDDDKAKLENLMAGETIKIQIHEDITYEEIYEEDSDNLWNFMFFTGYFRKIREWMENGVIYAELAIPNREVKYIFGRKIQKWFDDNLRKRSLLPLYEAVINKDCKTIENELNDIFEETISYMDQNEYYYHGMTAGILTGINGFSIRSNRESGNGRSDLWLKPVKRSREAFIIEFKVTKDIDKMDVLAVDALKQIKDRNYDAELLNDGYKHIVHYGIAFCGKECAVRCSV